MREDNVYRSEWRNRWRSNIRHCWRQIWQDDIDLGYDYHYQYGHPERPQRRNKSSWILQRWQIFVFSRPRWPARLGPSKYRYVSSFFFLSLSKIFIVQLNSLKNTWISSLWNPPRSSFSWAAATTALCRWASATTRLSMTKCRRQSSSHTWTWWHPSPRCWTRRSWSVLRRTRTFAAGARPRLRLHQIHNKIWSNCIIWPSTQHIAAT